MHAGRLQELMWMRDRGGRFAVIAEKRGHQWEVGWLPTLFRTPRKRRGHALRLCNHRLLVKEGGKKPDVRHPSYPHDHPEIMKLNAEWATAKDALAFARPWLNSVMLEVLSSLLPISPTFSNLLTHSRKHFVSNLAELKEGLWDFHSSEEPLPQILQIKTDKD